MDLLCLHFDKPEIQAAFVSLKKKKLTVRALKIANASNAENVKQLYKENFKEVVSSLSGKDLIVRPFELKLKNTRHLVEALTFQSQSSSIFPPEELLLVPLIFKKEKREKGTKGILFTTSNEVVSKHLSEMKTLNFDPKRVSAAPLSIVEYIRWRLPELNEAFIIDLGLSSWTVVSMQKGKLDKSFSMEEGISSLFSSYWEDQKKFLLFKELEEFAKNFDLKKLHPEDLPIFYKKISKMREELSKVIFSFYQKTGATTVIFTGKLDSFFNIKEFLMEGFLEAVEKTCNRSLPQEELKYAVPIGLALTNLQLRQGKFFPASLWKSLGKKIVSTSLFSFCISSLFLFFGLKVLQEKRSSLKNTLSTAISSFTPSFKTESQEEAILLNSWLRSIQKNGKENPFVIKTPKASQVLDWLSNDPLLKSLKKEDPLFEISEIHYEMIQMPTIGFLKNPYQTKVSLSFKTESPLVARKFHDFLLKSKNIDTEYEVEWNAEAFQYRTSFLLKDWRTYAL